MNHPTGPPFRFLEAKDTHAEALALRSGNVQLTVCQGMAVPRYQGEHFAVLRCADCGDVIVRNAQGVVVWVERWPEGLIKALASRLDARRED
jgi:hypothetical protein